MQKNEKNKKTFCRPLTNNTAYRFLKFEFTYAIKSIKKVKKVSIFVRSRKTCKKQGSKITAYRFLKNKFMYARKSIKKCITSFFQFMPR